MHTTLTARELIAQYPKEALQQGENIFSVLKTAGTKRADHMFEQAVVTKPIEAPIKSKGYFGAINWTNAIMSHTKNSLCMVIGSDHIASVLHDQCVELLERLNHAHTKGSVRVLVLNGSSQLFQELRQKYSAVLQVASATLQKPIAHFTVGDRSMVRIEAEHEPFTTADSFITQSRVYANNPTLAQLYTDRFNIFWKQVTELHEL